MTDTNFLQKRLISECYLYILILLLTTLLGVLSKVYTSDSISNIQYNLLTISHLLVIFESSKYGVIPKLFYAFRNFFSFFFYYRCNVYG